MARTEFTRIHPDSPGFTRIHPDSPGETMPGKSFLNDRVADFLLWLTGILRDHDGETGVLARG